MIAEILLYPRHQEVVVAVEAQTDGDLAARFHDPATGASAGLYGSPTALEALLSEALRQVRTRLEPGIYWRFCSELEPGDRVHIHGAWKTVNRIGNLAGPGELELWLAGHTVPFRVEGDAAIRCLKPADVEADRLLAEHGCPEVAR